jgi:serine/threonine-protein kinase
MRAEAWGEVERLLHEATQLSHGERAVFVANIGNADVRAEILSLLAALDQGTSSIDAVIAEAAQTIVAEPLARRHFSHFQVIEQIGRGGMGEVYLARDVKLGRQVAVKLLPTAFQRDPDRLRMFEREARAAAALNHPNIMAVYEVGECEGQPFIAAEYVEGKTLAQRLRRGSLSLEEAKALGMQIADALAAAHEKGIVHRDLKPANIKLKPDGTVKVLDFGLAKLTEHLAPEGSLEDSALRTQSGISPEAIVGTPAYMSPEQARGLRVDKRTDIWAFGAVFYEMLTGKCAFEKQTIPDTLAAVVSEELDFTKLPAGVRAVVGRCLNKDVRKRWQDIGDVRLALEEEVSEPIGRPRSHVPWLIAGAACVIALLTSVELMQKSAKPSPQPPIRLRVDLGPEARLLADRGQQTLAIAPDATRIAFACAMGEGESQICTRRLDQNQPAALAGTGGVQMMFFSPDSRWIGFSAHGKLKKVSVEGGAPMNLCETPFPRGAAWARNGFIVASVDSGHPLMRIPENGGTAQPLTSFEAGERRQRWPQILPGGEAVLFTSSTEAGQYENASLDVVSLKTGKRKTLHRGGYYGRYLPGGYLIYMHQGTLFAARMDLNGLALTSPPAPLLEDVASRPGDGGAEFDFSQTGMFVYQPSGFSGEKTVQWLEKSGKLNPLLNNPAAYDWLRISPDGKRLAIIKNGPDRDIWIYDFERRTLSRATFGGVNDTAVWSPDSKHLAYSFSGRKTGLWWARADGASEPQEVSDDFWWLYSFSPDGQRLAFSQRNPEGDADIWTVRFEGADTDHPKVGKPEPFLRTPAFEGSPAFSPDGRWLAYTSDESGSAQIYVRPFPEGALGKGGRWQISTDGGSNPIWSRNRPELFYTSGQGRLMAVAYRATPDVFTVNNLAPWCKFQVLPAANAGFASGFIDLDPGGDRFAVLARANAEPQNSPAEVNVWFNFFDELRRRTEKN